MACSKFSRGGRTMRPSGVPEPVVEVDTNGSTNGYKASACCNDKRYNMSHKRLGKLIIFNHKTYKNVGDTLKERTGTEKDRDRLEKVFMDLHYEVDVWEDFSASEVFEKLQEEAGKDAFYRESGCLVVAVLTHGEEDDRIWANDERYRVETLWEAFMGDNCKALVSKPKVVIIQACRGVDVSAAVQFGKHKVQTDGPKVQPNTIKYSIPSEADILIAYSSYAGKAAHRCELNGTWYIQELCKELELNGKKDDFLSILTNINRHVAEEYEFNGGKQMPTVQHTLTRKIFLAGTSGAVSDGFDPSRGEQLNQVLETVQELKDEPRRLAKRPRPSNEWDAIKPKNPSFEITESDNLIIALGHSMRLLLTKETFEKRVHDDGNTLLNLLAVWGSLPHDVRCFALDRLGMFFRTHGQEWEMFPMVLPLLREVNHFTSPASTSQEPREEG